MLLQAQADAFKNLADTLGMTEDQLLYYSWTNQISQLPGSTKMMVGLNGGASAVTNLRA